MPRIQRALISVTDKSGLADFARELSGLGVEIVSTGGTARLLRESGIAVRDISDVTEFPEMMDGRLKTIHPKIAGGVLGIRSNPEHVRSMQEHGIPPIDLVVVNLYAFEKVAAREGVQVPELIENIDIGGPTLIRAAAKNYQDVAVVVSSDDYARVIEEMKAWDGDLPLTSRWRLAKRAFRLTADYDRAISARLASIHFDKETFVERKSALPAVLDISAERALDLRYGENPHQEAALYAGPGEGIGNARQLHGKELSYNNLVDLDAAWQLICEFEQPAAAIIKHTNPCGCAEAGTLADAYRRAFESDPVSPYGGVLAFNREVDRETAQEVAKTFIEAIAAPGYSSEAVEVLSAKKNLRLLQVGGGGAPEMVLKSITGGYLAQTADTHRLDRAQTTVATDRAPSEEEWRALEFAWKVCKHVKSNAIVYAREGQTVGVGAGQMSRVDSARLGAGKAVLPLAGAVVASDAYIPFADGVEEAARHGVTAVIQPGGSIRDNEVVAAANRLGLAMVFTGVRHFRH